MNIKQVVEDIRQNGIKTAVHNILFGLVARRYKHLHGWDYGYEAGLEGANLVGADMGWAALCKANLYSADLTGADLRGANLTGIIYDSHTVWPDGFVVPQREKDAN